MTASTLLFLAVYLHCLDFAVGEMRSLETRGGIELLGDVFYGGARRILIVDRNYSTCLEVAPKVGS